MSESPNGRFHEGDLALLIDRKDRRYLLTLRQDGTFHTHVGSLPHSQIIGYEQGTWCRTTLGQTLLAIKPTLGEYVLAMPRGSQVIYPKDLGNILIMADVFPGATVVEAGLGSGALTATLLRAVGEVGRVITYEVREDMVAKAMRNLHALLPDISNHTLHLGDIYLGIEKKDVDRIVLDVPEPWHAVSHAAEALAMGGILLTFSSHNPSGPPPGRSPYVRYTVPDDRDRRNLAPPMACCPKQRPPCASYGCAHRIYHHSPQVPTQKHSCTYHRGIGRSRSLRSGGTGWIERAP